MPHSKSHSSMQNQSKCRGAQKHGRLVMGDDQDVIAIRNIIAFNNLVVFKNTASAW